MLNLTKIIQSTAKKHKESVYTIYESFIDMAYQTYTVFSISQKYQYLHDDLTSFYHAYLNEVQQKPFEDVLGYVLLELNLLDKKGKGQCFTPQDISYLIAKLGAKYQELNGLLSNNYYDCCCGSGSLALEQMRQMNEKKQTNIHFILNDLDLTMVKTAVVQFCTNNLFHLTGETHLYLTATCSNALTTDHRVPFNERLKGRDVIFDEDKSLITEPTVEAILLNKQMNSFNKAMNRFKNPEAA